MPLSVLRSLGIDVLELTGENAVSRTKQALESGDYAIIFITEDWSDKLRNILDERRRSTAIVRHHPRGRREPP